MYVCVLYMCVHVCVCDAWVSVCEKTFREGLFDSFRGVNRKKNEGEGFCMRTPLSVLSSPLLSALTEEDQEYDLYLYSSLQALTGGISQPEKHI